MPRKKKAEKDTVTIGSNTIPMDSPRVKSAYARTAARRAERNPSALNLAGQDAVRRAEVATLVGNPQLPVAVSDSTALRKYR